MRNSHAFEFGAAAVFIPLQGENMEKRAVPPQMAEKRTVISIVSWKILTRSKSKGTGRLTGP